MTLVNCAVVDNDRQLANPLPLSIFSENHSNCMMPAACVERGGELRQVGVPLTALDLLKLGEQEAPCVNLATVARCASSPNHSRPGGGSKPGNRPQTRSFRTIVLC